MTEADAIKGLRKLKSFHNGSYGAEIAMAIEALEKQIQKKPEIIPCDDDLIYVQYICPNCDRFLTYGNNKPYEKPHHCRCGQAIDWR